MSDEENAATGETPGKMEESTRTGVAFFDKLPAEIRNEIYYLAYGAPGDEVVKITSVKEIVRLERHRRRYVSTVSSMGSIFLVDEWLIKNSQLRAPADLNSARRAPHSRPVLAHYIR